MLELDLDEFERCIGQVFWGVRCTVRCKELAGSSAPFPRLPVGVRKSSVVFGQEDSESLWMRVHDRLLVWPVTNPKDPDPIVFVLDFVVLGIGLDRVEGHREPASHFT